MMRKLFGEVVTKVEIDETYVTAGEKGNKNLERKPRKRGLKVPPERGTFEKDKAAIITFVNRNTRETMFFVPEYKAYSKLESAGYQHKIVNHSIEYVNGNAHINNCKNRHSLLKPF